MTARAHAIERMLHEPFTIDDERGSHNSFFAPALQLLLLKHTVTCADFAVLV
jgi:hypothetical protein